MWIYPGALAHAMDSATWLRTTQELRKLGWSVTLVVAGPSGIRQIRGVEAFCISLPNAYLLRQVVFHFRVLRLVLRERATTDVLLFHEMSALWLLPLRAIRNLVGNRQPLFVMDTRSLPMPPSGKSTWRDRARARITNIAYQLGNRYADGRLAITPRMAEALHIPTEKLWGVWPSGADLELFAPARHHKKWPSADDPVQIVHHGSLHYERNLMTLCRAVVRANTEGMSFTLSLAGDGTERAALEEYAAHTNGIIRVLSTLPHAEIPWLLGGAHVGALPFPDEEKFRVSSPIKLFEYMAAGLPILATHIACHTDVVAGGEYAFWAIESDEQGLLDALRLVWRSRGMLSTLGEYAAMAAPMWTWEAAARKLKQALETGIASRDREVRTVPNESKPC